jgi:hypothetical protein
VGVPPFTGFAVKLTEAPAQTVLPGFAVILTEGVTEVFTVKGPKVVPVADGLLEITRMR